MATRGVNKVILIGNVGGDPETRYLPNGNAITNITLATGDSWKDKQTGQVQERTEWHRVVFFGKLAEVAAEYLRKGSQVYIEGRLQTRKWQDQSGQDRYTTEVVVDLTGSMQFLGGGRQSTQGSSEEYAPRPARPTPAPARENPSSAAPNPAASRPAPPAPQPMPDYDSFDDDIPF